MEARLKKRRNRLIRLILLILPALFVLIFIFVSVIWVQMERDNLKSGVKEDLHAAVMLFFRADPDVPDNSTVYLDSYSLLLFKQTRDRGNDVQFAAVDSVTDTVVADSAYKLMRKFSKRDDKGDYQPSNFFVDYNRFDDLLSKSQRDEIEEWLNKEGSDGREYQLVCSDFYDLNLEVIPCELTIVYTDDQKPPIIKKRFFLDPGKIDHAKRYRCSEKYDNITPKDFLFGKNYGQDLFGEIYGQDWCESIPEELREQSQGGEKDGVREIETGFFENIYFSSETISLDVDVYSEDDGDYVNQKKPYIFLYAKKANLIKNLFNKLMIALAVLSAMFMSIGFLLSLMVWKSFSDQILYEKKRRDLTNALAHDIKTPLFVISGYAYSLKENIAPEERESSLDRIIGQTDRIDSMVHRMLNLSKLDSYVMTLNYSEFDLNELTEDVLQDFTLLPDGKRIEVIHSGDTLISADRELIRTAIQNLIDNAVKYSFPQSIILIDVSEKNFSISNPSEPLSKAELKKIWQPYYRQDKSRHKKGNGLGLSIVKAIFDLHDANYNVSMMDGIITFSVKF